MSANKRPVPLLDADAKTRPVCPVCGSVSYSVGGVHPQCSMEQWDRQHMARVRATAAAAPAVEKPKPSLAIKAWHRLCPRCGKQSHFRKPQCACGHDFTDTRKKD